jgi:aspartyl-tRNA synthetase
MFDFRRTHTCGALKKKDIKTQVTLSGWVHRWRDHGGLIFIDLRDRFGITQLVFDPKKNQSLHAAANQVRAEWVISCKGVVISRAEGMTNPKLATGEIEVEVTDMEVLSQAKTPPFSIAEDDVVVREELRLKYRYLDIRRGKVAERLALRHKAMIATRNFLDIHGFLEIQTPILALCTPETGAKDYIVPSRVHPGHFYALPQSPQVYKQLLMVAGMDRYFQVAPCFRDEDLRADRQPEFTQIDIEMSFGTPEELLQIVEGLVKSLFQECLNLQIPIPFPRMTYADAVENYGTDKPDTRFGMKFSNLDDIALKSSFSVFHEQLKNGGVVKGFCVKGGSDISRKQIDGYTEFVGRLGIKGLAWMKMQEEGLTSNIAKFFSQDLLDELVRRLDVSIGDLIFMVADLPSRANQGLDHLRRQIAKDRNLASPDQYNFLWVTDFPLFHWNEEERIMESEHHPFTSPHFEDLHLLETDPLKVRSLGYDLVLNGYEIAGGSQRIHNNDLQRKIFELLKLTPDELDRKFGFFIEALQYGTPPHLGIALGLDRVMMLISKTDNIRDVIAFPKTQKASDLMSWSPSIVTKKQLVELQLKVEDPHIFAKMD